MVKIASLARIGIKFSLIACFATLKPASAEPYESRLIDSLYAAQFQDGADLQSKASALILDYPNSQTAHLIMADLLAARAGVIDPVGLRQAYSNPTELNQLDGLRDEMRLRWNLRSQNGPAHQGLVPAALIQLAAIHQSVVFVDAENARLYVYNNQDGELNLAIDNFTTIGAKGKHKRLEGDERTPIGVYHITRYIQDSALPPRYGSGAFPINYPNVLDNHYKRTGYGIWLHGTHPDSFNRVPLASDGCVAMSNPEFDQIKPLISVPNKTPVIISDHPNWVKPEHLDVTRNHFNSLLNRWVEDWESLDTSKYLSHYDNALFFAKGHNYRSWAEHKKIVIGNKNEIVVALSDISFYAYPGEENLVVAEFNQDFQSNTYNSQSAKRQYWKLNENDEWKIIHEGLQSQ